MKRNRAPADMIFASLLVFFAGILLVFGLSECGRAQRDLERSERDVERELFKLECALAGAPK